MRILRNIFIALLGIFLLVFFLSWFFVIAALVLLGFIITRLVQRPKNNEVEDNAPYEAEFTVEEQTIVDNDRE